MLFRGMEAPERRLETDGRLLAMILSQQQTHMTASCAARVQ